MRRLCFTILVKPRGGKFLYPVSNRTATDLLTCKLVFKGQSPHLATGARDFPGVPGRIRTCGLLVRNQTLYPLSYGDLVQLGCTSLILSKKIFQANCALSVAQPQWVTRKTRKDYNTFLRWCQTQAKVTAVPSLTLSNQPHTHFEWSKPGMA